MSVTRTPIRVLTPDGTQEWALDRAETDEAEVLALLAPDGREWTATAENLFHALAALRLQVEPDGIRLCCNGARRDVYPSRMALSMAGGEIAYLLRRGRRPSIPASFVSVLDPADCSDVVTVEEQRAWYDDWWRTVTGWRWPLYALLSLFRR
ncbi:hypothetical protein AB0J72_06795 [Dactylosporangium sp. NPDC049742]|uniref:hypothetical protein n=1 Tax=Dactylosporangium sp. NPDC049742 TaxID=3154737 RepID=UPI00342267C0